MSRTARHAVRSGESGDRSLGARATHRQPAVEKPSFDTARTPPSSGDRPAAQGINGHRRPRPPKDLQHVCAGDTIVRRLVPALEVRRIGLSTNPSQWSWQPRHHVLSVNTHAGCRSPQYRGKPTVTCRCELRPPSQRDSPTAASGPETLGMLAQCLPQPHAPVDEPVDELVMAFELIDRSR